MEILVDIVTTTLAIPAGAAPAMREFARWLRDNPNIIVEDGPTLSGLVTRYLWEMDR